MERTMTLTWGFGLVCGALVACGPMDAEFGAAESSGNVSSAVEGEVSYTALKGDTYYGIAQNWLEQNSPDDVKFGGTILVLAEQLRQWDATPAFLREGETLKLQPARLFELLKLINEDGKRFYDIFPGQKPMGPSAGAIALYQTELASQGLDMKCAAPNEDVNQCYVARVNDSVASISEQIARYLVDHLFLSAKCFNDVAEEVKKSMLEAKAFGADNRVWANERVIVLSFDAPDTKNALQENYAPGGLYRCAKN